MRVYIEYRGDSIEVPRGETLVGRDLTCALRFNDPAVSRRHLRFIRRHDEVFVEDLRSANGTLLNGRLVTSPLRLREGDVISIGNRALVVRVLDGDGDVEMPKTLVPENADGPPSDELARPRAVTGALPRQVPPPAHADQRCPQCGAAVAAGDVQCVGCGFRWSEFRPGTPTVPPFLPLTTRNTDRQSASHRLIYVSSELEVEATSRDLSSSGVFVSTQILEPVSTPCKLTFLIDGAPTLELSGVVRRVAPDGLGIEFTDLTDEQRARIAKLRT